MIRIVDVNGQLKVTTNQQFRDNTFAILGSADQTKRLRFEVDGLTTATTRTATMLDASGTVPYYEYAGTWTATQTIKQSGDTSNPGFRIQRLANDSILQVGYRSGSDSWEYSATFGSTGAYKPITWLTSDLERMRLDTSGNLGIGGTPFDKLDVYGGATVRGSLSIYATSAALFSSSNVYTSTNVVAGGTFGTPTIGGALAVNTSQVELRTNTNHPLVFIINGTEAARFDTSRNLGIGVTPAANSGTLQVKNINGFGAPVTSGTAQTYGIARFRGGNSTLDIGQYSSGATWFQGTDATTLAANYDLVFQPNGGNLGIGVTPTAGNGLLQLASGTTKANGVAFGTDTWLFRKAGGQVQLESGNSNRLTLHTINNDYSVLEFLTNDSSAHTVHLQGSSYGLEIISAAGNNGLRVGFTTGSNNPYKLWVNGASRFDGNVGFNSTAPIAKPTAAAAATDAATTQTLANSLRTILIDYGLAS